MLTDTSKSLYAKVTPIDYSNIKLTSGFWSDIVKMISSKTVPHLQSMFEDKTVSHVLENFRICAGEADGDHDGTVFGDGDFYKWMEAALYSYAMTKDAKLLTQLEAYCSLISRAQLPDGYISTKQIIGEKKSDGIGRMGDVNDFEIYNMGHLFTTACLYLRVTKSDALMKVALKAADYLEELYLKAKEKGEVKTAVCPSHYMGLIELYRTTEDKRYLDLAKLAIELRDSVENGSDDNQDRIPLKEHTKIVGHAVRSNYLYAGVADLYAETGDEEYLKMLHLVWRNLVDQKIYITGGCGALYNGVSPYGNFFHDQKVHQAYGYEYQLPNITAYNESCASVGLVLWAYRMFLVEPKSEYIDWIERAMLNVNLAAISLDGEKYFYENVLQRTLDLPYELVWPLHRTEYIFSYCCPPNIARTLSQVGEYFYFVSKNSIWCGLYGANETKVLLDDDLSVTLVQETNYPYEGFITIRIADLHKNINKLDASQSEIDSALDEFSLNVRIPHWVRTGFVRTSSRSYNVNEKDENGYLSILVKLQKDEVIDICFDMDVRYTRAHSKVEETVNQAVIEKGPLVYCMESDDVNIITLDDVMIDLKSVFEAVPYEIKGRSLTALKGKGYMLNRSEFNRDALYQSIVRDEIVPVNIQLIPYFAWDNRGEGEMKTWLPIAYR